MAKRGPKSKYDPKITPQVWKDLVRAGQTDAEIARALGVSRNTLDVWRKQHPEIQDTLKEGKEFVDSLVADSLLKRALGYECEETEISLKTVIDGYEKDDEGNQKPIRKQVPDKIKKIKKQIAPDPVSCIFWLKNRQPAQWRDKHEHELSGKNGGPIQGETTHKFDHEQFAALFGSVVGVGDSTPPEDGS